MSHPDSPKKPATSARPIERSGRDPKCVGRGAPLELRNDERVERSRLAAAPILRDLASAGFSVESLDQLRLSGIRYKAAVPVLLKWLPQVGDPAVKESIVRALSVPWAKPAAAIPLLSEFRRDPGPALGLKWTIGNALSVVANDDVFLEISEILRDQRHGRAREMLAAALGNMKDPKAVDLLVELLEDDEVAGHALMALGKLKARSARPRIQSFLNHPKAWVRRNAEKALLKLDP